MENTDTRDAEKQRLVDAFFGITASHRIKEIKAVGKELRAFATTHGSDPQVDDILQLVKMANVSRKNNDFRKICRLVKPILVRIGKLDTWELTDLRILVMTGIANDDFTLVARLFERALALINNDYATAPFYNKALAALYYNVASTLFKLNYLMANEEQVSEQIQVMLHNCLDIACERHLALSKTDKVFHSFYGASLVRKGLLADDALLVEQGIALVQEHGEQDALRLLIEEKEGYEYAVKKIMGKTTFRKQVSANIRRLRLDQKFKIPELAEAVGVHPNTLATIERAERGMSEFIFYSIARVLGVSTEELLPNDFLQPRNPVDAQLKSLLYACSDLSPERQQSAIEYLSYLVEKEKQEKEQHRQQ